MFWTECFVCEKPLVSKTQPRVIVSYKYDLKGHRRERTTKLGSVCSDCNKRKISFGPVQVIAKEIHQ